MSIVLCILEFGVLALCILNLDYLILKFGTWDFEGLVGVGVVGVSHLFGVYHELPNALIVCFRFAMLGYTILDPPI